MLAQKVSRRRRSNKEWALFIGLTSSFCVPCYLSDIIDGNLKLILGMIWTLILRFTIADISEEGVNAKEGLLLWCQRKTAPYAPEVEVENFTYSWKSGLALCALIHRHRPDLLDYNTLPKDDAHACTSVAFRVAAEHLGIPQLLDVEDLCDSRKPDERSVMTYVAQYFHAFSSMEQAEVVSRRVATFVEVMQSVWVMRNEYEQRAQRFVDELNGTRFLWAQTQRPSSYGSARSLLAEFNQYKSGAKRAWVQERTDLTALLGNIQTKLKTYNLRDWRPQAGLRQRDLDAQWATLAEDEVQRSRMINQAIREAKEALRVEFARCANAFEGELRAVSAGIAKLKGDLESQKAVVMELMTRVRAVEPRVSELTELDALCSAANVEENDHTVFTLEDLKFELELVIKAVTAKSTFIDNQIVARQHTNLTPAQLEEFESTFRYFDKDGKNHLTVSELGAALASLGMVYSDADVEQISLQLEDDFGSCSYDAFLTFLREITEDTTSPDQLLEAFQGLAGDKPFVTELDLREALLPQGSIQYLKEAMPQVDVDVEADADQSGLGVNGNGNGSGTTKAYDYEGYLQGLFWAPPGAGHDADTSIA